MSQPVRRAVLTALGVWPTLWLGLAVLGGIFLVGKTEVPLPLSVGGSGRTLIASLAPIVPALRVVLVQSRRLLWLELRSAQRIGELRLAVEVGLVLLMAGVPIGFGLVTDDWVLVAAGRNELLGIALAIGASRILSGRLAGVVVVLPFLLEPTLLPGNRYLPPPDYFPISAPGSSVLAMGMAVVAAVVAILVAWLLETRRGWLLRIGELWSSDG